MNESSGSGRTIHLSAHSLQKLLHERELLLDDNTKIILPGVGCNRDESGSRTIVPIVLSMDDSITPSSARAGQSIYVLSKDGKMYPGFCSKNGRILWYDPVDPNGVGASNSPVDLLRVDAFYVDPRVMPVVRDESLGTWVDRKLARFSEPGLIYKLATQIKGILNNPELE